MEHPAFVRMLELAKAPEALEATVNYLDAQLRQFLKRQERFLICFPRHGENDFGTILEKAVRRAGGIPIFAGPDFRWKALLKQAFSSKATAIAGPPLVILGLTKLARAMGTPLFVRNVLLPGYPCMDWMADGIQSGLDCRIWGCYDLGQGSLVGGFSCGKSRGVHLRSDVYSLEIVDETGAPVPPGQVGDIVIWPNQEPSNRYPTLERGRLETSPCACGNPSPRLMELGPGRFLDPELAELGTELLSWTSILDCRLSRGPHGLEMELVTFPGEKLPKLPSCARQVIRPWDPEQDMPFWMSAGWKNTGNSGENH